MNERKFAVVIDEKQGPMVREVLTNEVDSFAHDVVEGWFEAVPIQNPINPYGSNLIMLVNEEGIRLRLGVNVHASLIARTLIGGSFIFGNAVIFEQQGVELVPFTEDDANMIALAIKEG